MLRLAFQTIALVLALLVATPLLAQQASTEPQDAAAAADAVMKSARERAEADERAASQQLLRESRILFPQRAGQFELQRSARDPEPRNGVTLVYRYDGNIDSDFEVIVWPVGQVAIDAALALAARRHGGCMNLRVNADVTMVGFPEWKPRTITLADGNELEARVRRCSSLDARTQQRLVHHALLVYRDFYLIELNIVADSADSHRAAKLVNKAADELFPRIHVQSVGNCMPPARPKLVLVDEIDRGADRVSTDGAYIYATKKPSERELDKLLAMATERRRKTSCVVSFSMASLLPDEKFETLRFPAGSFTSSSALAPARGTEK